MSRARVEMSQFTRFSSAMSALLPTMHIPEPKISIKSFPGFRSSYKHADSSRSTGVYMRYRRVVSLAGLGFFFLPLSFATPAFSTTDDSQQQPPPSSVVLSHVRVVRLSFVDGTVTVRSPGSTEWAPATINVPIQEGFSLATDQKSFAEVQFENGSTMRIGELSSIDFTELALTPQGGHINHLTLDEGY